MLVCVGPACFVLIVVCIDESQKCPLEIFGIAGVWFYYVS